ncbi:MAG: glycosyltransferase [Pseudomonadota bacterium]
MPDVAIVGPSGRNPGQAHGGITPVLVKLANALRGQGREVAFLFFPREHGWRPAGLDPGVRQIPLAPGPGFLEMLHLASAIRRNRARTLLCAGHRYNRLGSLARRFGLLGDTRLGLSVHNTISSGLVSAGGWRKLRRHWSIRSLYPAADVILCVSRGVADDLGNYLSPESVPTRVIYNPIVDENLKPLSREPAAHPWFDDPDVQVVMGMGRLHRQKDFATLLKAFARLDGTRPELRLMILGEGPERASLQSLAAELGIEDRMDMPGFVTNPYAFLARADVFALSSLWEGFGNVLVESMAVGTPVVSTDCPAGPREILEEGRRGTLVPPGDPEALAQAIAHSLDHPPLPEELMTYAERFSAERAAREYAAALQLAPAT